MRPDHAHFAEWDAAYVLGALAPDDRRAYEAHLDGCAECRRATAELAPTVGLLSRVPAARAQRIEDDPPTTQARDAAHDEVARAGLASLTRARRRRRRTWWTGSIAAAVIVVGAVAVPATIAILAPRPAAAFALEDVAGVPLEASVRLTDVAWGTRIDLECRYPDSDDGGQGKSWVYALAIVDANGEGQTVSTWRAWPGLSARLSAGVALESDAIGAVEIRAMDGTVLMRYELGQPG
ncbi:zf-HC2 domain-containing protein [Microbacterium sp. BWT-B31]|uniref:anti-sigma factor family protein n=1 Tax=Microbacterium sp. BWT-B31 TaxID=3232072 RepID=UPI003529B995